MKLWHKIVIIVVLVALALMMCSFRKDDTSSEFVPILEGYERVEIINLQSTENGTYIYVLRDTATNTEYLYVYRAETVGCASSIVAIGDYRDATDVNTPMEETITRNNY